MKREASYLTELLVVSCLILLALWIPPVTVTGDRIEDFGVLRGLMKQKGPDLFVWRVAEQVLLGGAGLFIFLRLFWERRNWSEAGLAFKNFGGACRLLLWPTLLPIAGLLLLGTLLGSLDLGADRFWKKLLPATFTGQYFQQAVVQLYFNHRAVQALGRGPGSVLLVTLIFAAFHLPNPALTLGTAYGMWFWARTYQKAPNLLALALSHMLLSAFLWHTIPEAWRPSLTVGWRFVERTF